MKKMTLLFLAGLFTMTASYAADPLEGCERFLISLNQNDQSSKGDLVEALNIISRSYNLKLVSVLGGPILVAEHLTGVYSPDEDRPALNATLERLQKLNGVAIQCDATAGPNPSMSGSN